MDIGCPSGFARPCLAELVYKSIFIFPTPKTLTFGRPTSENIALKNILKLIHPGSVIHLSEFLLFEENPEMKDRYLKDLAETEEYGTFFVYNKEGKRVYQTHNFKESEIQNLTSEDFEIVKKEFLDFKSYSGKIKPGIILLLKKKNKNL